MNKLTAHKNDIILLLILAIAGLCVTGGYRLLHRTTGDTVTITVDGRTYRTLPLSVDTTLDIPDRGSVRYQSSGNKKRARLHYRG